jgi:hypothetical protein
MAIHHRLIHLLIIGAMLLLQLGDSNAGDSKISNIMNAMLVFVCFSRTSNFSAIWRLSPLLATGLQI